MKQLEQKLGPKWWNETEAYKLYHLREMSGVIVALWCIYYIATALGLNISNPYYVYAINIFGLLGAVIHSSTWLGIMPQLTPFNLSKKQQSFVFGLLILVWLGVSATIFFSLWM